MSKATRPPLHYNLAAHTHSMLNTYIITFRHRIIQFKNLRAVYIIPDVEKKEHGCLGVRIMDCGM